MYLWAYIRIIFMYLSVGVTKIFLYSELTVGSQSYWTSSTEERMITYESKTAREARDNRRYWDMG